MSDNPGCLGAIFGLFGERSSAKAETGATGPLPYRLRDDFLSPAELAFYRVLMTSVDDDVTVLTKVNLADLFFVSQPRENASYRNRIDRKHVDFVLCEAATMRPLVGIELDDRSHDAAKRQERDRFVDRVFETAGLPLEHVPLRSTYSVTELRSMLTPHMSATRGEAGRVVDAGLADAPIASERDEPVCPKCGVPLVVRTRSRGERKGEQFYGCPNYPRCRETAPFA